MKKCTRFFTQEQIDEIRMRLAAIQGAKDSQFEKATYLNEIDQVAIVQDGKNKRTDISELRRWLYTLDEVPTLGSNNAVTSNGIYTYIQDVINNIEEGGQYLYIKSDSEMFDYLIHGIQGGRDQSTLNLYCDQLWEAIENNWLVVIDDAICLVTFKNVTEQGAIGLKIECISNYKYISIRLIGGPNSQSSISGQHYWTVWAQDTKVDTSLFLINSNQLDESLSQYNTIIQQHTSYINSLTTRLNNLISEYESRMEETPKYHKLNWLTDEKAPNSEDQEGGYEITDASSAATALTRFQGLWWAIKDGMVGDRVSKMILYYGIPALYAQADNTSNVNQATVITVRLFDGKDMTSYKIKKKTRNGETYLYVLPTPIEVVDPEDTPTPDPDPEPESPTAEA